jgi:hypothetical protein
MFLQLWQDAASGSFRHHTTSVSSHTHAHHHEHSSPSPLTASERNGGHPTLTAFVVSGWSQAAMLVPDQTATAVDRRSRSLLDLQPVPPADRVDIPESPPPRNSLS